MNQIKYNTVPVNKYPIMHLISRTSKVLGAEDALKICGENQELTHAFFHEHGIDGNKEELCTILYKKIEDLDLSVADKTFLQEEVKKYVDELQKSISISHNFPEINTIKTEIQVDVFATIGMKLESWIIQLSKKVGEILKMSKK